MRCPYLHKIDEKKQIIYCGTGTKYLDYTDTRREICCKSFTKCKTYLCRQLAEIGVQLPWSEYNAEKLLEIYQQKMEGKQMNEIIETNTEQVASLELLEQQIINQCRIQAQSFAETGKLLKKIKDGKEYAARGYESFAKYMDEACGTIFPFKSTQAYKYIRVFENYGPRLEQYGTISLDILDMFKDMPADEFEQLAEENNLENMSVKEAEKLREELEKATEQISFLQSTVKEKEEEYEGKLATAQGRIKNMERELDELNEDYGAAANERNELEAKVEELKYEVSCYKNKAEEVIVKEPDPEEIKKRVDAELEKSAAAYKAEISKLEKNISDLKKEQAESADNIKEGYEKKLQALNDKLDSEKSEADERVKALEEQLKNSGKADEALIEFKFYFSNVQENLKKFLAVLDKIEDAEKKEKFKGAAVQFLEMILGEIKS